MTTEPASIDLTQQRDEQLRQLEHDLRSYLGVITMGLIALEGAREHPAEFVELRKSIEEGGIEPLKEVVAKIVDVASKN